LTESYEQRDGRRVLTSEASERVAQAADNSVRVTGPVGELADAREQIPELGFREYWYPACGWRRVPHYRPAFVKLLGDEICLFRGRTGVAAVSDLCPHRGAHLSDGRCHYRGTVSCPYHGWTFDESGSCVAALSEGPDSSAPTRSKVRTYPTAVLKDVVFIWMGDGPPTDPAVDLPPELTDDSLVLHDATIWRANWRPALENLNDNHTFYVHRNALQMLMRPLGKVSFRGARPIIVGGGVHLTRYSDGSAASRSVREYYPAVSGNWPRSHLRSLWSGLFATTALAWLWRLGDATNYPEPLQGYHNDPEWDMGPHMPGMQRINGGSALYTRWCVPIDATTTREFYLWATRPTTRRAALWERAKYPLVQRLLRNRNLGLQDGRVLSRLRFDTPERLTRFDLETIGWRRLAILSARHGGRHDRIPPAVVDRLNAPARPTPSESDDLPSGPDVEVTARG
jgi:nitrite reductase/ring-hydroxylating ferredoxin subunit